MNLEQYKSLYQKIEVPQELSERVLHRAQQAAPAPVRWKKAAFRATAVCCAFALVVGGVAIAGSHHAVVTPASKPTQNAVVPAKQQNRFDLAVYAAEKGDSQSKTVALDMKMNWGPDGSPSFATGDDGVMVESQRVMESIYHPDILCTGNHLKSVQYSWDTSELNKWELVKFNKEFLNAVDNNGKPIKDPNNYGKYDHRYSMDNTTLTSSFTVDYAKKDIQSQIMPYYIRIETPMTSAEFKEYDKADEELIKAEIQAEGNGKLVVGKDTSQIMWSLKNAKTLEKARLVVKATFTDGTTQQKRYRISPIEEKTYKNNLDGFYKLSSKLYAKQKKLFKTWPTETDSNGKRQMKDSQKYDEAIKKQIMQPAWDYQAAHPLCTLTQVDN